MEIGIIEDPDPAYTGRGIFYTHALKPLTEAHENIEEIALPPEPDPDSHPARYLFPGYARPFFHKQLRRKWWEKLRKKISDAARNLDRILVPHHMLLVESPDDLGADVIPYVHDISPVTTVFSDEESNRKNRRRMERLLSCDVVVCASRATESDIVQRTPFQGETRVIYQGVDNMSSAQNSESRDIDLLYVGALHQRKDPTFIRSTIRDVQAAGFSCLAVNSKEIDIPCDIKTKVSESELANIFSRTRFYLHPSRIEGFGRSPVEAQSRGVVPLARDIPINHEVLGGRGQSWYSVSSTEEVLEKLREDLRSSTRKEAQRNAERFQWTSTRNQLLELVTSY